MGYDLNIQRQSGNIISKQEWTAYMESDVEFERMELFSTNLQDDNIITLETPNGGLWKSEKGDVPFTFYEKFGEITVKNPEQWIIEKMIIIANDLNAVVIGEEGEIYDKDYLKDSINNLFENEYSITEKKWWQFWK